MIEGTENGEPEARVRGEDGLTATAVIDDSAGGNGGDGGGGDGGIG
jgi:hypothetical protein